MSPVAAVEGPKAHKTLLARLRRLNKAQSRKRRGSRNAAKAKRRLARLHARIANIRRDAAHKLTTRLTTTWQVIGIEDLNVREAQRRNQAKALLWPWSRMTAFRRAQEVIAAADIPEGPHACPPQGPAARLWRAGRQPGHSPQHGAEMAGTRPAHHHGYLCERRG
jgi:hypothetical protein